MEYAVVCAAAVTAACLTLVSGFGLGTLLLPAFALFFPVEAAVAATAIVHLTNNLFKGGMLYRDASLSVALRFGLPAGLFAMVGAYLLTRLSGMGDIYAYEALGEIRSVTPVELVIGVLLGFFALVEILPDTKTARTDRIRLEFGGALSGFFGGLSGLQGAIRSAFLINAGLDKRGYIATSALIAVTVDAVRIPVYGLTFAQDWPADTVGLVSAGCLAAFAGSFIGRRLVGKVTIDSVRRLVGLMLLVVSGMLVSGMM
jgi:hypothetical protein